MHALTSATGVTHWSVMHMLGIESNETAESSESDETASPASQPGLQSPAGQQRLPSPAESSESAETA